MTYAGRRFGAGKESGLQRSFGDRLAALLSETPAPNPGLGYYGVGVSALPAARLF